jgi:hypothetical protein
MHLHHKTNVNVQKQHKPSLESAPKNGPPSSYRLWLSEGGSDSPSNNIATTNLEPWQNLPGVGHCMPLLFTKAIASKRSAYSQGG